MSCANGVAGRPILSQGAALVTKPIQTINRYKADLREFQFLLFEQFKLGELLGKAPFEAWGPDEVKTSIAEC